MGSLLPDDGYTMYIAGLSESDIDFSTRDFKNPMSALIHENDSSPSGPATKVAVSPTDAMAAGYSLEGIVWNNNNPLALVNNQVVGSGEKLEDGAVVTEITRDTVRFNKNGNRYYLVLREE